MSNEAPKVQWLLGLFYSGREIVLPGWACRSKQAIDQEGLMTIFLCDMMEKEWYVGFG